MFILFVKNCSMEGCTSTVVYTLPVVNTEQVRKCTCNVTLWHVLVTVVAVEKKYVLRIINICVGVCVCVWPSLSSM